MANWFLPETDFSYTDGDGNPYLFFKLRNDENFTRVALIRFNVEEDTWEDIIGEQYLFNNGAPHGSQGVGLEDGSCIVVTKSGVDIREPNHLYKMMTNGTPEFIGPNPIPSNVTGPRHPDADIAVGSDGVIYFGGATLFGDENEFKKWTGTEWIDLPSIIEAENHIREISLGITDEGEVYAAYEHTVEEGRFKKVVKLNTDETAWEVVHTTPYKIDVSVTDDGLYVKNNDIYMLNIAQTSPNFDFAYKLIHKTVSGDWEQLGPDFDEAGTEVGASLLKANDGSIYLAPGSGNDTNIYRLNVAANTWDPLLNDIVDGGPISGQSPYLTEGKDGRIYNIFRSSVHDFTGVVLDPEKLGTTSLSLSNIAIYPNPFGDSFNIELPENVSGDIKYEIADISGRIILTGNISEKNQQISTSNIAKGIYILSLKGNNSKNIAVEKIIKE